MRSGPGSLGWAAEWRPWLWRRALATTFRAVDDWTGLRVCELGCGSGRLSIHLAGRGASVVGYELDAVDLDAARRLAASMGFEERVEFRNYDGDVSTIEERFDVVVTKSVLIAMPPDEAVHAVRSLLSPGGRYLGTENRYLPAFANRVRRYGDKGLGAPLIDELHRHFSTVDIRSTYGLVASIVATT